MKDNFFGWGTRDEIAFIDGLGSWRKVDGGFEEGTLNRRLKLLVNYRASIFKRRKWGMMMAGEVLAYVNEQIQREQ